MATEPNLILSGSKIFWDPDAKQKGTTNWQGANYTYFPTSDCWVREDYLPAREQFQSEEEYMSFLGRVIKSYGPSPRYLKPKGSMTAQGVLECILRVFGTGVKVTSY